MKEENFELPVSKPQVPFHTIIKIEIKGKTPMSTYQDYETKEIITEKGIPATFFEYIQDIIDLYQIKFKDLFIVVSLEKKELEP